MSRPDRLTVGPAPSPTGRSSDGGLQGDPTKSFYDRDHPREAGVISRGDNETSAASLSPKCRDASHMIRQRSGRFEYSCTLGPRLFGTFNYPFCQKFFVFFFSK